MHGTTATTTVNTAHFRRNLLTCESSDLAEMWWPLCFYVRHGTLLCDALRTRRGEAHAEERVIFVRAKTHRHHLKFAILFALCMNVAGAGCQSETPDTGQFIVLLDSSINGFDPRFPVGDSSAKLIGLIHAGLVSTDTRDGKPEMELAQSITQRDATTYDIVLRQGSTFHDGRPVTSQDVEYTLMELGSELVSSPLGGMSKRIKSFTIVDDHTFSISLHEPRAPFIVELSMGIVPKHLCDGLKQCPNTHIGAGPFKFVGQSDDAQTVRLENFDGYVLGKPEIERLTFKVVKDDNTRLIALLGKSADMVQNAVSPLMLPVVEDANGLTIKQDQSFKYTYMAFNMRREILQDVRVRQAIAHGLDRESIIKHKYRGLAQLSTGMLAPAHWAYEGDVARYAYNQERAKQLLDEAGYPDPDGDGPQMRFELELKVSSNKFRRALAQLMSNQLARIGIGIKVRSYEWGTYFHDIKSGNFDLTTLQWPSVLEPSLYHWVFHSSNIPSPDNVAAGANRGAYRSEEIDRLLDEGMVEVDVVKRKAIYAEVQRILARDLPYVSLWHEDNVAIMREGVTNYFTTPNARFEALKQTTPALPAQRNVSQAAPQGD